MLGWLWRVIVGRFSSCEHEWEDHKEIPLLNRDNEHIGNSYLLRCKKCGEYKEFRVNG